VEAEEVSALAKPEPLQPLADQRAGACRPHGDEHERSAPGTGARSGAQVLRGPDGTAEASPADLARIDVDEGDWFDRARA